MLQIYNSLTNQKEEFKPIEPGKVKLYVCGMTVYDYNHIGHARAMIVFDVVVRYLKWSGYDVTYIRNITDIDDKIIHRAQENGEQFDALTARFIEALHEDEKALKLLAPNEAPRATHHIPEIITMIEQLFANGYAYVGENGDVFFDVRKFDDYGALANRDLDDLRAGARVGVVDAKRDPLDFVLWKLAKPEEPSWSSPWGEGRPGWHIECSAMSGKCLGNHFDIHGGGMDLSFPHHENEIAQSVCATGEKFVNTWMHAGFLQVDKEKMSKSLGNFFTIREVLAKHHPEVLRLFMISTHYRQPVNYSEENLQQAKQVLDAFYVALRDIAPADELDEAYVEKFQAAMNDDFNTPGAMVLLHQLVKEVNVVKSQDESRAAVLVNTLLQLAGTLGLLQDSVADYFQSGVSIDATDIEQLIEARNLARADKNWAESDRIRDQLLQAGIVLEDGAGGTTWRKS